MSYGLHTQHWPSALELLKVHELAEQDPVSEVTVQGEVTLATVPLGQLHVRL